MNAHVLIKRMILIGWIGLLLPGSQAQAITYSFTEIARAPLYPAPGDFTDFPTAPSINSRGVVAFNAQSVVSEGIYRGTGGLVTTIVDSIRDGFLDIEAASAINAAGQVAFKGLKATGFGVFRGDGTTTTTIADAMDGFAFGVSSGYPGINARGTVSFAGHDFSYGLFTGSGGAVTAVYRNGAYGLAYGPNDPAINDAGEISFLMNAGAGSQGVAHGSGGPPVIVGSGYSLLSHPSIDPSGRVAFRAGSFGAPFDAIWTGLGPASATVLANISGPFSGFPFEAAASSTTAAFLADLDAGGRGLFTGPDVTAHKVLTAGESLFGDTVLGLPSLNRNAVNGAGQIAFLARLTSGDLVVVRATPERTRSMISPVVVPEPGPAAIVLLGIACVAAVHGSPAGRCDNWPSRNPARM